MVSCPSCIHHQLISFFVSNPRHHALPNASVFIYGTALCRMTTYSGPQTPLPNALRKTSCRMVEGPIRRTRGGSEWEPIKILLEGDEDSNKTNTASNKRLGLTTQVGQAHIAIGVPLDLGTNTQPSEPKHTNTYSGNLHGLLPVPHQSDRWPAPVRPVTPVRPVDSAGQAGGYSSRTTSVPESLSDLSRPWNKTIPKTQHALKESPTQNLTKQLQTDQELTSSTKTQRHTSQAVHPRQIPQVTHTGQTGQEHQSDRCILCSSG
jgi:hypothetical protein